MMILSGSGFLILKSRNLEASQVGLVELLAYPNHHRLEEVGFVGEIVVDEGVVETPLPSYHAEAGGVVRMLGEDLAGGLEYSLLGDLALGRLFTGGVRRRFASVIGVMSRPFHGLGMIPPASFAL